MRIPFGGKHDSSPDGQRPPRDEAEGPHDFARLRHEMIEMQLRRRGIRDERVLQAMAEVPRHRFVREDSMEDAYADRPLPIGEGQTISQPFMVAAMAEALSLQGDERVLEIGAGSGYQAAVLSLLAAEVIGIEARPTLVALAREHLADLNYSNLRIEAGDGSVGWQPEAPYDAILVSAAAPRIPQPLFDQLVDGGRLVIPVGNADFQQVLRIVKQNDQSVREILYGCRYVPLIGRHGWRATFQEASSE